MLIFLHVELKTTANNNEELKRNQLQIVQKHSNVAVTAHFKMIKSDVKS
jgi:hypothetical protein